MSEEIRTSDDVKRLFGQYHTIADLIGRLGGDLKAINDLNVTAGGQNDEVAQQYQGVAGPGTQALNDLLKMLKDVTATTGESGQDVQRVFQAAEEDAQRLATDWDKMSDTGNEHNSGTG